MLFEPWEELGHGSGANPAPALHKGTQHTRTILSAPNVTALV